jgi:Ca2+-binding EF-hand superfamily protein
MFLGSRRCQGLLGVLLVVCSPALAAPRGDTNGDGKLDLAEFQAKLTARLMKADTNGDGRISLEEWQARPAARNGKRDPAKVFSRLDKNGDGFLDDSEIAALAKRRFHHLDADSDGFVTEQELQARKATAKH